MIKQISDRVSNTTLAKKKVNQWKNTHSVMEWYCHIKRKEQGSVVVFDIESFYPSISTKLFDEAAPFPKLYYDFTSDELEMIMLLEKHFCSAKIVLGLEKWAMKILTYQWDVMMAQIYADW